jgi:hypothetical protein
MRVTTCKYFENLVITKQKQNGEVEEVTINKTAVAPIFDALIFLAGSLCSAKIRLGECLIRVTKAREFLTIKDTETKAIVFVPMSDLQYLLGQFGEFVVEMEKAKDAARMLDGMENFGGEPLPVNLPVSWNTQRSYTVRGQRLGAVVFGDHIIFCDLDRGIDGTIVIFPADQKLNSDIAMIDYVMSHYDVGGYVGFIACSPEERQAMTDLKAHVENEFSMI